MAELAHALLQVLPQSMVVQAAMGDLKAWILREEYYVPGVPANGVVQLFESSPGDLCRAFRRDFALISCSAVESFVEVRRRLREDRALAWAFVKGYYAAYFAAHAWMRLYGEGTIWADQKCVESVARVAKLWSGTSVGVPSRGSWDVRVIPSGMQVSQVGGTQGGSHELLWKRFGLFLESLSESIAKAPHLVKSDAVEAILALETLRSYFSSGRFVAFRHEVNYRRGFGTWHPFNGVVVGALGASALQARLARAEMEVPDDFSKLQDQSAVVRAVRSLIAIVTDLILLLSSRFPKASRDLKELPLRLLRESKSIS